MENWFTDIHGIAHQTWAIVTVTPEPEHDRFRVLLWSGRTVWAYTNPLV